MPFLVDWWNLDKTSGTGDDDVTVSWSENTGVSPRGVRITLACGEETAVVTVNQEGGTPDNEILIKSPGSPATHSDTVIVDDDLFESFGALAFDDGQGNYGGLDVTAVSGRVPWSLAGIELDLGDATSSGSLLRAPLTATRSLAVLYMKQENALLVFDVVGGVSSLLTSYILPEDAGQLEIGINGNVGFGIRWNGDDVYTEAIAGPFYISESQLFYFGISVGPAGVSNPPAGVRAGMMTIEYYPATEEEED